MQNTMQLFERALSVKHAAAWANDLNLTRATFSMAKKKGRLSPVLAGNLAMELGEDPEHWVAIAALEAEPQSTLLERLKKSQALRRKLCPPTEAVDKSHIVSTKRAARKK